MFLSVLGETARIFDTTPQDILSASKWYIHVRPRWALAYALHLRGMSYKAIGRRLNKDHSTIIHAVRELPGLMYEDEHLAGAVQRVVNYTLDKWPPRVVASDPSATQGDPDHA